VSHFFTLPARASQDKKPLKNQVDYQASPRFSIFLQIIPHVAPHSSCGGYRRFIARLLLNSGDPS